MDKPCKFKSRNFKNYNNKNLNNKKIVYITIEYKTIKLTQKKDNYKMKKNQKTNSQLKVKLKNKRKLS